MFQLRNCPLCGADPARSKLEVEASMPAEKQTADALKEFFIGFRSGQCFFSYYRCNECSLLWCPTYFSEDFLTELYSQMPPNVAVSGETDSRKTQSGYAKQIIAQHSGDMKILEIGADIGLILQSLIDQASVSSVVAVEPNTAVHAMLKMNTYDAVKVYENIKQVPRDLDINLVVAIHVLDHLLSPSSTIGELANLTNDAHTLRLFSVVHDENSFLRTFLRRKWAPFCLQHPQLFNEQTLTTLYKQNGFTQVLTGKTTNWLEISQMAALANQIGLIPHRLAHLAPNVSLPVKLGNIYVSGIRRS